MVNRTRRKGKLTGRKSAGRAAAITSEVGTAATATPCLIECRNRRALHLSRHSFALRYVIWPGEGAGNRYSSFISFLALRIPFPWISTSTLCLEQGRRALRS